MNRRDFLVRSTAGLASLGLGCKGSARRADLTIGVIGVGGIGMAHLVSLLARPDCEVVAVADPYSDRVEQALQAVLASTGNHSAVTGYHDYRDLLARDDIAAVLIATPDHWHARPAIDAARAGKHVYCEKPLTLTISEGRAMVKAARKAGIAFQTGSQQRSTENFQLACEIVRNGRIGQLLSIDVHLPDGPFANAEPALPIPDGFDWNLWLGPAPETPYHQLRANGTFRYFRNYSGGNMTDIGAHMLDIAQWGSGHDDTGPISVRGTGTFDPNNFFETPVAYRAWFTYANSVTVCVSSDPSWDVIFIGSDGELTVARGQITASRPEILDYQLGSGTVTLETSRDHYLNWFDAINGGPLPICDVEIGHRSATLCHLANIAIESGRELTWDPVTEHFVGDADADSLLSRPYRAPWEQA